MNENEGCVDPAVLREKASDAIHRGRLPNRRPDRTWGGTGSGRHCVVCGANLERDEPEIELEFAGDDVRRGQRDLRVHVRCLAAWEQALDELEPEAPAAAANDSRESAEGAATRAAAAGALPAARHGASIASRGWDERTRRRPA